MVEAVVFALLAYHVANQTPVTCPAGLLRSKNALLMNVSLLVQRKITNRADTQSVCPFAVPSAFAFANGTS